MKCPLVALLCLAALGCAQTNPPHKPTAAPAAKAPILELIWHDVQAWGLEGRAWPEQQRLSYFDRFPAAAEKTVTKNVWGLSRDSAGMMVRFRTDARVIHAKYKLTKAALALPHMPATGVSGLDLYARDVKSQWRWVNVSKPVAQAADVELANGLDAGERDYALYLPLYNGIVSLELGIPQGAKFIGLTPRAQPIVFYGTSITHGACASRPGMVHTAILGRRFDVPVVNLGFSGNGRMDAAVGDFLAQIDAAAYVIDCLPNMGPKDVTERTAPLVHRLRATHPTTPIILVEDRRNTNAWIFAAREKFHTDNHAALMAEYEKLVKEGVKGLSYIPGDHLYGDDADGATDGSHASDLGFYRQADIFQPFLKAALGR